MYCAHCNKDYDNGITICPDCKQELVEETVEDIEVIEAMKPVKVASAANSVEAGLIMNLLRNNGIQSLKKDNGIGGYMNLYYGFSVYGVEIYVDESDYEKASEIIKELSPELRTENDQLENEEENEEASDDEGKDTDGEDTYDTEAKPEGEDSYKDYPFYKNPRALVRIYIIGSIAVAVLIYILGKIVNQ